MRVHGKFDLRFGIELGAWRDSGITPLWCVLTSSASFSTLGHWLRIKQRFDSAKLTEESRTADRRRIRVDNRTMLITSWRRVLDALQKVAAERGRSAIEQDIVQLRGLAER